MVDVFPLLAMHAGITTVEIVLGFLAAVVIGIALALGMHYFPALEATLSPVILVSQVIPKVALGPLFMIWLGFGLLPKVVIAFLIAFFPLLIDTAVGLRSTEPDSILLLQSMGADRYKTFRYLLLPNALPNIFAGAKVAITLATVGAIVGEFVGASAGLGYLLQYATGTMDATLLFSALITLTVVAILLYGIVAALERASIGWHVSHRTAGRESTM
jgi:NitT/TauT family transport system permease protein